MDNPQLKVKTEKVSDTSDGIPHTNNVNPVTSVPPFHKSRKRLRCDCYDDITIHNLDSCMKTVDLKLKAICMNTVNGPTLMKALEAEFKNVPNFDRRFQKVSRMVFGKDETVDASVKRKMHAIILLERKILDALHELRGRVDKNVVYTNTFLQKYITLNMKLNQIRPGFGEGNTAQTTEHDRWSFLCEKSSKK